MASSNYPYSPDHHHQQQQDCPSPSGWLCSSKPWVKPNENKLTRIWKNYSMQDSRSADLLLHQFNVWPTGLSNWNGRSTPRPWKTQPRSCHNLEDPQGKFWATKALKQQHTQVTSLGLPGASLKEPLVVGTIWKYNYMHELVEKLLVPTDSHTWVLKPSQHNLAAGLVQNSLTYLSAISWWVNPNKPFRSLGHHIQATFIPIVSLSEPMNPLKTSPSSLRTRN